MDNAHAPRRPQPLRAALPIGNDPQSIRHRIEALEKALEHGFRVPGTRYEFGLDAIVGLIPVVGDVVGAAFGAYLVWEAKNLGMSKWKLWRMAGNVGLDTAVGLIPFIGDAMDFLFRSNTRNLKILTRHLDKHHPQTRVIDG